jgi:hypothetical protein
MPISPAIHGQRRRPLADTPLRHKNGRARRSHWTGGKPLLTPPNDGMTEPMLPGPVLTQRLAMPFQTDPTHPRSREHRGLVPRIHPQTGRSPNNSTAPSTRKIRLSEASVSTFALQPNGGPRATRSSHESVNCHRPLRQRQLAVEGDAQLCRECHFGSGELRVVSIAAPTHGRNQNTRRGILLAPVSTGPGEAPVFARRTGRTAIRSSGSTKSSAARCIRYAACPPRACPAEPPGDVRPVPLRYRRTGRMYSPSRQRSAPAVGARWFRSAPAAAAGRSDSAGGSPILG